MLTGTPLQNDLGELHNLLRFLLPDVFKEQPPLDAAEVLPPCASHAHAPRHQNFTLDRGLLPDISLECVQPRLVPSKSV